MFFSSSACLKKNISLDYNPLIIISLLVLFVPYAVFLVPLVFVALILPSITYTNSAFFSPIKHVPHEQGKTIYIRKVHVIFLTLVYSRYLESEFTIVLAFLRLYFT